MDKTKIAEFFNRLSTGWDAQLETDGAKIHEILDVAGVRSGLSVLDIACGTGVLFDYYLGRDAEHITGVDISEGMLGEAKKKYAENSRVELILADAEEYSFPEKYDCCMVFNAFPHFCEPERLLKNLKAALKDGGTLTVAHDWGRAALDEHHKNEASDVSCGLMASGELEKLFTSCGFRDIYCKENEGIYIVSGIK